MDPQALASGKQRFQNGVGAEEQYAAVMHRIAAERLPCAGGLAKITAAADNFTKPLTASRQQLAEMQQAQNAHFAALNDCSTMDAAAEQVPYTAKPPSATSKRVNKRFSANTTC